MLKLWNSLTRTREAFGPINPPDVGIYSCGPTVYSRAHIGNFRAYVVWDILKRVLGTEGYKVTHVMNITDVGHLTGDGDEGQDKMQESATKEGKTAWEIAKVYEELFKQDAKELNIVLPEPPLLCKATDHIPDQIKLIQILEEKGYTYRTSDGIYFDTTKFPEYGKLSGQPLEEKLEGARVESNPEKKHSTDFALWKFSYPGGVSRQEFLDPRMPARIASEAWRARRKDDTQDVPERHMEWESPWGLGFPGWHLECSAMSRKYLGQPFDIHTGGVDHIPVHHENEIAQSVAAYAVPLANYWLHSEFLTVDGQKMSKSLGNTYTLEDCAKNKIDSLALRYFYLGAQYRSKLNFTWQAAEAAQIALDKLRDHARSWEAPTQVDEEWNSQFMAEMQDDLNTPAALAVVWDMVKSDMDSDRKAATLLAWDSLLGIGLNQYISQPLNIPQNVKAIADRRWEARSRQDWNEADNLRLELENLGWTMEDGAQGYRLKPKK